MKPFYLLSIFGVLLLFPALAGAGPLSYYSCDISLEKLVKTERALKAAETDLQNAEREEELIRTELRTCLPRGVFPLARTRRCSYAHDGLLNMMKQTIEATYRVEELQQAVHERQVWQMKVCQATP